MIQIWNFIDEIQVTILYENENWALDNERSNWNV